jgi:hypothetical protein
MPKICEMRGVREYTERYPVELWWDEQSERLVILSKNEGGCNETQVDLYDVISWLMSGPGGLEEIHGNDSGGDSTRS